MIILLINQNIQQKFKMSSWPENKAKNDWTDIIYSPKSQPTLGFNLSTEINNIQLHQLFLKINSQQKVNLKPSKFTQTTYIEFHNLYKVPIFLNKTTKNQKKHIITTKFTPFNTKPTNYFSKKQSTKSQNMIFNSKQSKKCLLKPLSTR